MQGGPWGQRGGKKIVDTTMDDPDDVLFTELINSSGPVPTQRSQNPKVPDGSTARAPCYPWHSRHISVSFLYRSDYDTGGRPVPREPFAGLHPDFHQE